MGVTWTEELLGLPWRAGATGPRAFDCWGLVRFVSARHFGRALPALGVDADDEAGMRAAMRAFLASSGWSRSRAPEHGDGVAMSLADEGALHVGVWLAVNGGCVLHVPRGGTVVLSTGAQLAMAGWRSLRYYRPRD